MKILLSFDKNFEIDRNGICNLLNEYSEHIKFEISNDIDFNSRVLTKSSYRDCVQLDLANFDGILCFTDLPYNDNYFSHGDGHTAVISFWNWESLTNLPKSNGVLYFIVDILAIRFQHSDFRHQDTTGCIYDFLWQKTGVDDGMRQARVCPECLERISADLQFDGRTELMSDIKQLMNLLSDSSKWNEDILSHQRHQKMISTPSPTATFVRRSPKESGKIHIMIASPSDTVAERKCLLEQLEITFRRNNHEAHCRKRIIVHGWEELASQVGYPQDLINIRIIENVDIIVAVIKHKLGSPTIDPTTGVQRALSGTVEELTKALDGESNAPIGMLYFHKNAPTVSLDSPEYPRKAKEWEEREAFRKRISSKIIHGEYGEPEDLLQTVLQNIERNILDCFT